MAKLVWDQTGEKLYETGVSNCALYLQAAGGSYPDGVAWNGITAISESPSGAEPSPLYADNEKYINLMSAEEFAATVEAYMYPEEFAECDGSKEIAPGVYAGQQNRKTFGIAYKTLLGNDSEGTDYGYKLHMIYNCLAAPSEKGYSTVNDSPEAITFSWSLSTTPVPVPGAKATANLTIDSTKVTAAKLKKLEAILYGAEEFDATKTYVVGDVVEKDNKVYSCKTAISTPSAWSAASWEEISASTTPRLPLPTELISILK